MNKTIGACTYYYQNGPIIVNATNSILRVKEKDGYIVEIPSSVLPKGEIPKIYRKKAAAWNAELEEIFDGSIFINLKYEECKISDYLFKDSCTTVGNSVMDIISNIQHELPRCKTLIVGTTLAAKTWGNERVVEPIYGKEGIIEKYKIYYE